MKRLSYALGLLGWGLTFILTGCQSVSQSTTLQEDNSSSISHSDGTALSATDSLVALDFVTGAAVDELLPLFIAEERIAIADQDLAKLRSLWDIDGLIIDQRGTKNTEDDYIWRGRNAILDRYKIAVFRFSPPLIEPPVDLQLSCDVEQPLPNPTLNCLGNEIVDGTVIYASREGDRWQFIYSAERWWIKELSYNP